MSKWLEQSEVSEREAREREDQDLRFRERRIKILLLEQKLNRIAKQDRDSSTNPLPSPLAWIVAAPMIGGAITIVLWFLFWLVIAIRVLIRS